MVDSQQDQLILGFYVPSKVLLQNTSTTQASCAWRGTGHTGCEAALPNAMGPPPPLRVGARACDAMTLRDKPASDAGRNAMATSF